MRLTPRPYQLKNIQQIIQPDNPATLHAGEMGTGKTLDASETIRCLGLSRVLIIAPLNTHDGWLSTLKGQMPDAEVFIHPPGGKGSKESKKWWGLVNKHAPGFYIIGWEAFRGSPTLEARQAHKAQTELHRQLGMALPERNVNQSWRPYGTWDLVIADEVHRACNRKAITSKTLWTLNADRKLAMSGTPAGNSIGGYWAVLHWLWPEKYPYYWPWVTKFCESEPDEYSGRKIVGEKSPGGVVGDIPSYVRVTTAEVISDLPKVIERTVKVQMKGGAQDRAYKELENQAFTWLEGQPLHTPLPVTQSMRLRQVALGVPTIKDTGEVDEEGNPKILVTFKEDAKSNKIDALKDIITDIPEDKPVLILTHSARFVVPVVHQLNRMRVGLAVGWTGSTSQNGRARIKADFGREGGPRFIVAGIAAIGEGVDGLQHRCHHEVWLSQHDNNLLNQQAAARVHRPGQKHPVQRWYIQSVGTVDVKVYRKLEGNASQMRAAYRKENPR